MQTTTYKLNVTPGGVPLTIHISQYDVGLRQYIFQPYTSEGEFTYVSGATVTLEATKPDGYAVIHECTYNQDGSIAYTVQAQLAAKAGRVWSKVVIRNGNNILGTGAVVWMVDNAGVKDNAIVSDSDISALQQWMANVEDYSEAAASSASLAESAVTSAQAAATQAAGYVDQAVILGGTPLVAATVSAMSDHDRVYVYTGSETGYTAGNWYYWNGSAWTSGGIYNSSAVQTDPTLSVSGMAADAAATGELKNDFILSEGLTRLTFTEGYYITTNKTPPSVISTTPTAYSNSAYCIAPCEAGDIFYLNVRGGTSDRAWAFTDASYKSLGISAANLIINGGIVVAPPNAKYIIINTLKSYTGYRALQKKSANKLVWMENIVYDTSSNSTTLSGVWSSSYASAWAKCSYGDEFIVSGTGGTSYRLWAFVDSDGNILSKSASDATLTNGRIVAPPNAEYIFINTLKSYGTYSAAFDGSAADNSLVDSTGFQCIPFVKGGYINTSGNSISLTPVSYATISYAVAPCLQGDKFLLKGLGADAAAVLWTFADSSLNVIAKDKAYNSTSGNYIALTAPQNAAYLVCNANISAEYSLFKRNYSAADLVDTVFVSEQFEYGTYNAQNKYEFRNSLIASKDYLDSSIFGYVINVPNVTVYDMCWRKDGTSAGYYTDTGIGVRILNHQLYIHKLVIKWNDTNNAPVLNVDELLSCITVLTNKEDAINNYRQMSHENARLQEKVKGVYDKLKVVMKNDYNVSYANAVTPIDLRTYLGDTQIVHPKVLYFPNELFGHKYWMAYTPCGFSYDDIENPCVAYSEDGYKWYNIAGNPLDDPAGNGYDSDTHLVYRSDTGTLECWYRYVSNYSNPPVSEVLKRRTTSDGVTWTAEETLLTNSSGQYAQYLSPAVLWMNNKYCMWVENTDGSPKQIDYYESANATTWTFVRSINLTYTDDNDISYVPWHADVIYDNNQYILCIMCKYKQASEAVWTIFLATSSDNITYTTPKAIIYGNPDGWDKYMYRPSIVNVDGTYRIYYTGESAAYGGGAGGNAIYGVGITESDTLDHFIGQL